MDLVSKKLNFHPVQIIGINMVPWLQQLVSYGWNSYSYGVPWLQLWISWLQFVGYQQCCWIAQLWLELNNLTLFTGSEAIAAGNFLPNMPCLVHGKLSATSVELWLRTSSGLLTDSIAKLAQSMLQNQKGSFIQNLVQFFFLPYWFVFSELSVIIYNVF